MLAGPVFAVGNLRRAASGVSLPAQAKDGPGTIGVYSQLAAEVQVQVIRLGRGHRKRWFRSAFGRSLQCRRLELSGTDGRPGIDDAAADKRLAVRIADAVEQDVDILAPVLLRLGIEPRKCVSAAEHQSARSDKQHSRYIP